MDAKSKSNRRVALECPDCGKQFRLTVRSNGTTRQKCPRCGKILIFTRKTRRYDWFTGYIAKSKD